MSLRVHPDPQEPAGGYAFLELPGGSLPDGTVTVCVFDAFGERWLALPDPAGDRAGIGAAQWQPEPAEFGPYQVHRHEGADWVRIGPEIVNKLDEYMSVRLTVAGKADDVIWPDDVPPRAGAAVLGGLQPVGRKPDIEPMRPVVGKPEAVEEETGLSAPVVPEPQDLPPNAPDQEAPGRASRFWIALMLSAIVVAAVLLWYFWPGEDPAPQPIAQASPCVHQTLAATEGGFAAIAEAIRACGADVAADTALSLLEEATTAEDPDALLLFGVLYDGKALDPRIENLTGLTFDDDPAQAVEYYSRAVKAGSENAQARLRETCERLDRSGATLHIGAHDDFCS